MLVKAVILHCQQTLAQGLGHIVQPDQHPILAVGGVDPSDLHRIQPHKVNTPVPGSQALDPAPAQINQHPPRGLALIGEGKTPRMYLKTISISRHLPWTPRRPYLAIAQHLQLIGQVIGVQLRTRKQLQGAGVHLGGQLPHFVDKCRCYARIEIDEKQPTGQEGGEK